MNKKRYGFTIALPEYRETIETLWETTRDFLSHYPEYKLENSSIDFISDDGGLTYNDNHFVSETRILLVEKKKKTIIQNINTKYQWSNFEIGDLDFWRSKPYMDFFEYLDKSGGFYYERWGMYCCIFVLNLSLYKNLITLSHF